MIPEIPIILATMIDINIAEILITVLLDILLRGILENKVRNTFIIRIYPSPTYFWVSRPKPYYNIVYIF